MDWCVNHLSLVGIKSQDTGYLRKKEFILAPNSRGTRVHHGREDKSKTVMAPWAEKSESISSNAGTKQREWNGSSRGFILSDKPHWHTSFIMPSLAKPLQTVPPTGKQSLKVSASRIHSHSIYLPAYRFCYFDGLIPTALLSQRPALMIGPLYVSVIFNKVTCLGHIVAAAFQGAHIWCCSSSFCMQITNVSLSKACHVAMPNNHVMRDDIGSWYW